MCKLAHDRFDPHDPTCTLPDNNNFPLRISDTFWPVMTDTNTTSFNTGLGTGGAHRQLEDWDAAATRDTRALENLPLAIPSQNFHQKQCPSQAAGAAGGHWHDHSLAGGTSPDLDQLHISRQNPCLSHSLKVSTCVVQHSTNDPWTALHSTHIPLTTVSCRRTCAAGCARGC